MGDDEFARLIAPLGPFERAPRLAVAVSGGPDSLALCLLAAGWASTQGGEITALIVDHGLRAESHAEAQQTGAWLGQRGIGHHVLRWHGPKPTSGIQEAAREARYGLLATWCRANEVLHLLLAHHRDDQAETIALRKARQSGPDGLAGMAAVREIAGLRLLRPLLEVPKQRLIATLRVAGQSWIEDPSNAAERFARGRLRREPDAAGLNTHAAAARSRGEARAALDRRTAAWLAEFARIDPAGFVAWPHAAFVAAPIEIARRALQQALAAIGGSDYPPRSARLGRLLEALRPAAGFTGRTLAGCRILRRGADLLICREPAAIAPPRRLEPNVWQEWDRRFVVRWHAGPDDRSACDLSVRALGVGWRQGREGPPGRTACLPSAARAGLPSFWQGERLLAVPGLDLSTPLAAGWTFAVRFRPRRPLAGPPFIGIPRRTSGPLVTIPLLRSGDSLC